MSSESFNIDNEVMPSFFTSLNSRESKPLLSRSELERIIKFDSTTKGLTNAYRSRLAISKKLADEVKFMSPGISAAVQFDGHGKTMDNVKLETCVLMLDYDDLPVEQMEEIFNRACSSAYTMVSYHTISGRGLRIFVRYKRDKECQLAIDELYKAMLEKAVNFYNLLLGKEADGNCSDLTRISGLAHDENAYFHWDSTPLCLTKDELDGILKKLSRKRGRTKRKSTRRTTRKSTAKASSTPPTMEEAASHILQLLEQWGYVFESGRHNEYVCNFGKVCAHYAIDEQEATDYAVQEFGKEYDDTARVMKSCYKHIDKSAPWHFYREGEAYPVNPSVKVIKQWLSCHYDLHINTVTGRHEVRSRFVENAKYLDWTIMDDRIENSIWMEMEEDGIHSSIVKLDTIINSDFSEPFDPLGDYLKNLEPWDGKHDYINELADRVTIAKRSEYYHDQEYFRQFFRKWFVGMVVGWVTPQVVNQTILILIGKGGIYKTTFFSYLLPSHLREYFINDSTANYVDKDFMEAFASKALICLDEFDAAFGKNLSAFKSNITKLKFSIRRPYDRFRTDLTHRATLCGTSNNQQIITDVENRRYSPWIVKSIVSPQEKPINYDGVYAQAIALGKQVMEEGSKAKWVYWLTADDIKMMREHNQLFMMANYLEEQILRFYKIPDETTEKRFLKFRYNVEILERIFTNPAMRQFVGSQGIGSVMSRLGFPRAHKAKGNGWWVIEKDGTEINNYAFFDPGQDELS